MHYSDLCWKGIHASDLGVIVTEQVYYKRPAIRRDVVTVPGRSGTLTIRNSASYDVVPYSPALAIRPGVDIEAVISWLQGRGRVIFGSMPDSAFDAVIVDQVDVTEQSPGHRGGYRLLVPTFECQPFRYEVTPSASLSGLDYLEGWNPRNAAAAPQIVVTVSPGTVLTLSMSGCEPAVIEVPGSTAESVRVVLDCDAQTATLDDGTSLDGAMIGEYPMIAPGCWTLQAAGEAGTVLGLSMLPRWRAI